MCQSYKSPVTLSAYQIISCVVQSEKETLAMRDGKDLTFIQLNRDPCSLGEN